MPLSITVSSRAPTTNTASCNSETHRITVVDYCQLFEKQVPTHLQQITASKFNLHSIGTLKFLQLLNMTELNLKKSVLFMHTSCVLTSLYSVQVKCSIPS